MNTQVAISGHAYASPLMNPDSFSHMLKVGKLLGLSVLFPEHLRKGDEESRIANGVLVVNMALRLNEDPLTVAQNIYFVSGKPGWSSTYMIAKANQHGVFKDQIDWDITGGGDTLSVTAFGVLTGTGRRVAATCDMKMAKAEGWTKNTKYASMPEVMLRYRSAAALIRFYCPEVMVGVPAAIENELESMRDITPDAVVREPGSTAATRAAKDVEILDPEMTVAKAQQAEAKSAAQEDPDVAARRKAAAETLERKDAEDRARAAEAEKTKAAAAAKAAAKAKVEAAQKEADLLSREQEQARTAPAASATVHDEDGVIQPSNSSAAYQKLYDIVLGDMTDGATVAQVNELYGEQLVSMEQEEPDLYARLKEEMDALS